MFSRGPTQGCLCNLNTLIPAPSGEQREEALVLCSSVDLTLSCAPSCSVSSVPRTEWGGWWMTEWHWSFTRDYSPSSEICVMGTVALYHLLMARTTTSLKCVFLLPADKWKDFNAFISNDKAASNCFPLSLHSSRTSTFLFAHYSNRLNNRQNENAARFSSFCLHY